MNVDQKEIARILGITQATVSRALSDSPRVSQPLKARVRELCESMGYQPNYSARSLQNKRTGVISAVISAPRGILLSDMHSHWVACLQRAVHQREYKFRLDPISDLEQIVGEKSSDGFILFGLGPNHPESPMVNRLLKRRRPVVFTDCEAMDIQQDTVAVDSFGGTAAAVAHLYELGHRKIGFFGLVAGPGVCRERHAGYVTRLNDLGIPAPRAYTVNQAAWPTEVDDAFACEAELHRVTDEGVTAFVASSDINAVGVIRMLRKRGLRVPEDISVIGFDDTLLARAWDPPLTTVRQDVMAASDLAVDMLLRAIEGGSGEEGVVVPATLMVRGTTGAVPR